MSQSFQQILFSLTNSALRIAEYVDEPERMRTFLGDLGFDVPQGFALNEVGDAIGATLTLLEPYLHATDREPLSLEELANIATAVGQIILAVSRVDQTVRNDLPANYVTSSGIADRLPRRLLDWLVVKQLEERWPVLERGAVLLGVLERHQRDADPAVFQTAFTEVVVHWDRLLQLIIDPTVGIRQVYRWGQPDFEVAAFLRAAEGLLRSWNLPAQLRVSPNAAVDDLAVSIPLVTIHQDQTVVGASLHGAPPLATGGASGIRSRLTWSGQVAGGIDITPDLSLEVDIAGAPNGRFEATLYPNLLPQFQLVGTAASEGRFVLRIIKRSSQGHIPLLVVDEGLRIDVRELSVEVGVEAHADRGPDLFASLTLKQGRFAVSGGQSDGFLQSLLPDDGFTLLFDLMLGVSSERGLFLNVGGGLEATIPLHVKFGPLALDSLFLGLVGSNENIQLTAAISGSAALGPIGVAVERIGIGLVLNFQPGNLGPTDLRLGFKPPNGLGIAVDAGPISGGGFLFFDAPKGRYAGVLQIAIYDISVTAVGLLDTKDEAGHNLPAPGFSFLIIISVEFIPIQLGFGFTLNGVGGLAGIHRQVVTEALQSGLRQGILDHILFPQDPVRNAPQIISDLRTVFPVAVGRFVFGPMAKLGWGTPSIITAEIGIILELPDPFRIVLLGQAAAVLPEDAPVVRINVDVLGIIDFGRKMFSLDATIRDSFIGGFALSGDMAMRLGWGDRPNFALAVGGLNPNFNPPPNFPTLRRVMVSLGLGDNPRISIQGYTAITSNSIQFGALAELYAEAAGFSVCGYLGFDALIIFQPFFFRFDFRTGFTLRRGSSRIAGINIEGMLSGPSPFHLKGRGCIGILFFDVCVRFDETFGDRQRVELPAKDPWEQLQMAIADARNWSPQLPQRLFAGVSLKPTTDDTSLLFHHPMGRTTFQQKVIPLNKTLERFGEFAVAGANRFDIASVIVGDNAASNWDPIEDYMAPGLSEDLTDKQKITRDSYELEIVGFEAGSTRAEFGPGKTKVVEYEQRIVETPWRSLLLDRMYRLPRLYQMAMSAMSAKARSLQQRTGRLKFSAPIDKDRGASLADETWSIVEADTLTPAPRFAGAAMTKGQAFRTYDEHIKKHPADRAHLEVVSTFEVKEAV